MPNDSQWVFRFEGTGQLNITINADGSLEFESLSGGVVQRLPNPRWFDDEISNLKEDFSVPQLVVDADYSEVQNQIRADNDVSFISGLNQALSSFLRDGTDIESPFSLIKNDPLAFGLSANPDSATITEKIRAYMNQNTSSIVLLKRSETPERGEAVDQKL